LNKEIKYIDIIGFRVFSDNLSKIQIDNRDSKVINTISPNSYGISTKDSEFELALKKTDFLVLDGVYFALASILLQGKNIKKNQGPEVFYHFMNRLNENSQKAFFLGSSETTLKKIKARTKLKYPNIEMEYFSPPFKSEFSDQDNFEMIRLINLFRPDILFVGMTCPKQEKWAIRNREVLQVGLTICIGNVFDWYAGTQKVIHPIWFKLRLGWFIRIFLRPEVFRRNIGNQMKFFWHLLLIFIKIKKI
jgi:N-acetylglucosaminyldiphosphoundecaprenol N-acetyl-beta-D-mannosaminyltransferase